MREHTVLHILTAFRENGYSSTFKVEHAKTGVVFEVFSLDFPKDKTFLSKGYYYIVISKKIKRWVDPVTLKDKTSYTGFEAKFVFFPISYTMGFSPLPQNLLTTISNTYLETFLKVIHNYFRPVKCI